MAFNKTLGYDPDKDYSLALQDTSLTDAQRSRLLSERQAKIDNKYGGVEPNMTGKDKTFSQIYGTGGGTTSGSKYTGTNYHQDAIDAAIAGDWDLVNAALSARENKVAATGQNYGRTSTEILAELMELYGQPEMPTFDGGQWGSTLDRLANELVSMNYDDWTKSDQYQALVDRYGLRGKLAMQDVLGQISSRTGGLASSYAATAAQQQYNDYMATLEQAALDMYGVDRDDLMQNAQLVHSLSQDEYNRYLDSMDQYWNQMNRNDSLTADKAETLAGYGDFSGYRDLGYSDEEIANMQAAYQSQQAAKAASGETEETPYKPTLTAAQVLEALENGIVNDATKAAYEYYFGEPYGSEDEIGGGELREKYPSTSINGYGESYNSIWSRARTMHDSGKSDEEIMAFLDKFTETQLTDTGLEYIMRSLNLGGYRED